MADNLLSSFLPDDRAATGFFPQMKPRRRLQDVQGSANVPLDVTRGRVAGLAGLLPDVLNFMGRSPMPTEQFGETQYEPAQQLPYGSEYFLQNLPLKPTSRIGEVAGQAGAFVPLNPMPAARAVAAGARALGPTAVRMGEGYLQRQGLMPTVVPEAPVTPATPLSSMVEKPQAPVSPIGFYSAAEQAALALPRKSGTGDAFLNDLMKGQDVKKDELSWMGLDDYLKGKPNVTRQEVQDYIAGNRVDVQEVRLGEAVVEDPVGVAKRKEVFDKYEPEIQDLYRRIDKPEYVVYDPETNKVLKSYTNYDDALLDNLDPMGAFSKAKTGLRPKENSRQLQAQVTDLQTARDAEANAAYVIPEPTLTRYQNYQLPGGENYREILLKLPGEQAKIVSLEGGGGRWGIQMPDGTITSRYYDWDDAAQALRFDAQKAGVTYTSSHFKEPNILAHMRVNDRIDADGKKMLLIEEVQSDWHQAGREKGYQSANSVKAKQAFTDYSNELANKYNLNPEQNLSMYATMKGMKPEEVAKYDQLQSAWISTKEGVPDAPFKGTWHQLALKRALKYAADNGYDRVGLTTGKQQVERYTNEMRQNVDELQFFPIGNQNNILISAKKGGKQTFSGTVADGKFIDGPAEGKTVTEVLGKSMAKQIAEKKDGVIKGDDLTIGGEGMKAYYDEIYPSFLEKQGKKYNAKTGETQIRTSNGYQQTTSNPSRQSVRYIDISPEMRGGVKKGQPLFTAAPIGGIGLGAGTQDQQQNSINSFIQ